MSAITQAGIAPAGPDSVSVTSAQRDLAIDSLRGIAILMVIGIHSLHQPLDSALAKAVDAALRPAVPLFLFASGYLTARRRQIPVLKRLKSVLIPYTIAFVAAYLYMALHNPAMDHRPWITVARYGLGYVFVYYYVPVYIGCTLALWLIFKLCERSAQDADRKLGIILTLTVLFGILAASYLDPLLAKAGFSGELIEEARLRNLPFWFAFMALGVLAGMIQAERTLPAMAPMLFGGAAIAYAVYASVRILQIGDAAAYDSTALFVYAALLCLVFLAVPVRSTLLASIGMGSYFIYLWHIFVIMLLRDYGIWRQLDPALASLANYAATAIASVAALVVVRSIMPARAAQWLGA